MRTDKTVRVLIALTLVIGGVAAGLGLFNTDRVTASSAPTPSEVRLIEAIPFSLDNPMTHYWRSEAPSFSRGIIMVVNAPGVDLERRQRSQPVLCCGGETLAILNDGSRSGYAIVVMPLEGGAAFNDLSMAPLFFGPDKLPEQLTKAECVAAATNALATGTPVIGAPALSQALQPILRLRDESAVYRIAADLVERYSPEETQCIRWLRGN